MRRERLTNGTLQVGRTLESAVVKSRMVIETFSIKSRAPNNFWSTFSFPHRRRRGISANWSPQNEQLDANFSIKSSSSSSLSSCELFARSTRRKRDFVLLYICVSFTSQLFEWNLPADFLGTNRIRPVLLIKFSFVLLMHECTSGWRVSEELFAANDGLELIMKNIQSIVVRAWLMRSDIYCLFQRQIDTHSEHPITSANRIFRRGLNPKMNVSSERKLEFHEYLWKIMRKLSELVSLMICETFPIRRARCNIGCMHYARIKFIAVVNAINGKWIFCRLESCSVAKNEKQF